MRIITVLLVVLLAAGCSTSSSNQAGAQSVDVAEGATDHEECADESSQPDHKTTDDPRTKLQLWSREGLVTQDRMEVLKGQRDDVDPESTVWQETDYEIPEKLRQEGQQRAQTPGSLAQEVVAALGLSDALGVEVWEQTIRVFQEETDRATAVIFRWGLKDDSVAGADLRLRMEMDEDGWYVVEAHDRFHCARGTANDELCL